MPERRLHTVYVAVDIEAYDWQHAIDCVRAEYDAMQRAGHVSPMFDDVLTLNFTGREESLPICGVTYFRAMPHDPRDLDALRLLRGAVTMCESTPGPETARSNLLAAVRSYYRTVTGQDA